MIGSISGVPAHAGDPAASGTRGSKLRFTAYGDHTVTLALQYRVGASPLAVAPVTVTIHVDDQDLPNGPDAGDAGGGDDDPSGCCQTGGSPHATAILALLVLAGLRRRRTSSPTKELR
jgi:MYXO-CTERM domain-containing protein